MIAWDDRELPSWRQPISYARGLRWLFPPPCSTRRVITALLTIGFAGFVGVCSQATFAVQSDVDAAVVRYARAVALGNGASAYEVLCAATQRRTSAAELSGLAAEEGGVEVLGGGLRGSGSEGLWPWSHRGVGGVRLRIGGVEDVRYIKMRDEGGWKVCPRDGESLLGR